MASIGNDPMDIYSTPIEINETKLSKIFTMKVRDTPDKPGRILAVIWDERSPLISGFSNKYSYTVKLKTVGNMAGNHFHKIKQELFYPIQGSFTVGLEDVSSKEREEIKMGANKNQALYFPIAIAHVIRAESDNAIFLIVASSPSILDDELPYRVF